MLRTLFTEADQLAVIDANSTGNIWIARSTQSPYFVAEDGQTWTPIGQNDAITWPEFAGLYRRRDIPAVEQHLRYLKDSGITCLRLMLEYCQREHRYLERPSGHFVPSMVQLWDDLTGLCQRIGIRILLTPYDTFHMWNRWRFHPYNAANGGGPCSSRTEFLTCPRMRDAVKRRLAFATTRWGGDGTIFAWDLWNEMHPVHGENHPGCFDDFISDVGSFLRSLEIRLYGRAHLQCVSIFGPELGWKPWLNDPIFRHQQLDFASSHFYEEGTIDDPSDTVMPAISMGRLVRESLEQITDGRPFVETEHGPIHTFKDKHRTLPERFDDEYFRHMQWAHLASGGAGGGMRWPNRSPHTLTRGMRRAQSALAKFLPLIDWSSFKRRNLNDEIEVDDPGVSVFGCGDDRHALVWLLRRGPLAPDGRLAAAADGPVVIRVPGLRGGSFEVVMWDTLAGREAGRFLAGATGAVAEFTLREVGPDLAIAIRRLRNP